MAHVPWKDRREYRLMQAKLGSTILRAKTKKPATRVQGAYLADCVNYFTGNAWPSQKTMHEHLGFGERTIQMAKADLEDFFHITMVGRAFQYTPRWRDLGIDSSDETPAENAGVDEKRRAGSAGVDQKIRAGFAGTPAENAGTPAETAPYLVYNLVNKSGEERGSEKTGKRGATFARITVERAGSVSAVCRAYTEHYENEARSTSLVDAGDRHLGSVQAEIARRVADEGALTIDHDPLDAWPIVKAAVVGRHGPRAKSFLDAVHPTIVGTDILLSCAGSYHRDEIRAQYLDTLTEAWRAECQSITRVRVELSRARAAQ